MWSTQDSSVWISGSTFTSGASICRGTRVTLPRSRSAEARSGSWFRAKRLVRRCRSTAPRSSCRSRGESDGLLTGSEACLLAHFEGLRFPLSGSDTGLELPESFATLLRKGGRHHVQKTLTQRSLLSVSQAHLARADLGRDSLARGLCFPARDQRQRSDPYGSGGYGRGR
jgi:hypothetical protein